LAVSSGGNFVRDVLERLLGFVICFVVFGVPVYPIRQRIVRIADAILNIINAYRNHRRRPRGNQAPALDYEDLGAR